MYVGSIIELFSYVLLRLLLRDSGVCVESVWVYSPDCRAVRAYGQFMWPSAAAVKLVIWERSTWRSSHSGRAREESSEEEEQQQVVRQKVIVKP